jgi:hypothetical protein
MGFRFFPVFIAVLHWVYKVMAKNARMIYILLNFPELTQLAL